ncbi:hypothetical protein HY357_04245 [Candidatus Roizmanbacteria bacterium]|nr:hypothetical protein [Candidatus Roizmanbacteria bacterium]
MATMKMTFTIPEETYKQLISTIPERKRSKFISISIEKEIARNERFEAFQKARGILKGKYKMFSTPEKISKWVRKQRATFDRKYE